MKKEQMSHPSALLEYIGQTQASFQRTIANATTAEERRDEQLKCSIILWEVDAAQKYRLTSSALTMIARLKPECQSAVVKAVPSTAVWMMLDDEKCTTVSFSSIAYATTSYVDTHPSVKRMPKGFETIVAKPWLWDFQIMAMGDHPLLYLYDAELQKWTLSKADLCPVHRCELLGIDGRQWPGWYICDVCKPKFDYWTSWFPVALMAVNLDFAETEERLEPKRFTERERRKKKTDRGYKEVSVIHTYHIITFDISVKLPSLESPGSDEMSHPTWVENAIAEETVLYIGKHIEQSQRTFHHERYVNMRGKTIDVRAHDKRIPISVKRLKQTIHQAIARH